MRFKKLLDIAKESLRDLSTLSNPDFRLEQAELNKDKKTWVIVVSFLVENTNKRLNPLAPLSSVMTDFQFHRIYKKVEIDEKDEVVGLYIFNNKE